jgi:hypothetical protein
MLSPPPEENPARLSIPHVLPAVPCGEGGRECAPVEGLAEIGCQEQVPERDRGALGICFVILVYK